MVIVTIQLLTSKFFVNKGQDFYPRPRQQGGETNVFFQQGLSLNEQNTGFIIWPLGYILTWYRDLHPDTAL